MVRYDPYTDSFIDNSTKEVTATNNLDALSKPIIQVNVVEVSDASIEKIADAVVRKLADRKTEPTHDLRTETHECVKDTHDKTEPQICDTCRYYNDYIPCGSTPSACKEADKFAEEFAVALKKLKPKDEPKTQTETQNSNLTFEKDECAKEYEELGLKELKELIEADRKTEPQTERSE